MRSGRKVIILGSCLVVLGGGAWFMTHLTAKKNVPSPAVQKIVDEVSTGVVQELTYTPKLTVRQGVEGVQSRYRAQVANYLSGQDPGQAAVTQMVQGWLEAIQVGKKKETGEFASQLGKYFYRQALVEQGSAKDIREMKVKLLRLAIAHLELAKKI